MLGFGQHRLTDKTLHALILVFRTRPTIQWYNWCSAVDCLSLFQLSLHFSRSHLKSKQKQVIGSFDRQTYSPIKPVCHSKLLSPWSPSFTLFAFSLSSSNIVWRRCDDPTTTTSDELCAPNANRSLIPSFRPPANFRPFFLLIRFRSLKSFPRLFPVLALTVELQHSHFPYHLISTSQHYLPSSSLFKLLSKRDNFQLKNGNHGVVRHSHPERHSTWFWVSN